MTLASLFLDNWKELTATLSAVFLFFAGRKSTKLQEKKQTVDAVDAMQKTYDVFLQHYTKQYDDVMKRLTDMELRNSILLESSQTWERKFKELTMLYEKLKLDFDKYKKIHENSKL